MQRKRNYNRQCGASMWTLMILVSVAAFIFTIFFKLAPAYISNFDVKGVIDAFASEPGLGKMSNAEVRSTLERRFDINRVEAIKARCRVKDEGKVGCVQLERTRDVLSIDASYDVRVHIMFNVDAVVSFDGNKVEVPIVND